MCSVLLSKVASRLWVCHLLCKGEHQRRSVTSEGPHPKSSLFVSDQPAKNVFNIFKWLGEGKGEREGEEEEEEGEGEEREGGAGEEEVMTR